MQQDRLQDTTPHDARPQCAKCKTQDCSTVLCRTSGRQGAWWHGVVHWTSGCRTQDGCPTEVGWKSDECRTDVGRISDGRWTSKAQSRLLRWQVAALHSNSWQHNIAARLVERCNSLLWRGRQRVAARCCGEAGSGLQFVAAAMASSVATRDDGQ